MECYVFSVLPRLLQLCGHASCLFIIKRFEWKISKLSYSVNLSTKRSKTDLIPAVLLIKFASLFPLVYKL
jgi:hypothetical protein